MNNITSILLLLIILAVGFLIISAIVMSLYNYIMPKLIMSINIKYKSSDFTPIDYGTSCALVLLCSFLFGSSTVCSHSTINSKSYKMN